jgi:hypothetical protein
LLSFSYSDFILLNYLCACNFSLLCDDAEDGYQWEIQTPDGCTSYWEASWTLTTVEASTLWYDVACVSVRVVPTYHLISAI